MISVPVLALAAIPCLRSAAPQELRFQGAGVGAPVPLTDLELGTRLEAFVERLTAADLFSGAVALAHGDEVLIDRSFGEASKSFHVPNHTTTRFNLASASKMFTAVLVAQEVERGHLTYDAPVGRYLPDFPVQAARTSVTLHHLLTHTSGLGDLFDPRWERASRTLWGSVDAWMTLLADASLAFEPGTRFQYSNAGFLVLGAILERVTGKSWAELVQERVLAPAGMTRSGVFGTDEPEEDVAVGYTHERFGNRGGNEAFAGRWWSTVHTNPWIGGPAGGAYATTGDMLRFFRALEAGTLVPKARVEELLHPRVAMGNGQHYGYGFILEGPEGDAAYGHDGDIWGVSVVARRDRRNDRTLVVLCNYGDGAARTVARQLDALVRGEAGSGLQFTSRTELDPAARARLFEPPALGEREVARYTEVARKLLQAVNDEDASAYAALMAPGFLAGLDADDPWKSAFAPQLDHFGRIQTAWAPRSGPLRAGGGALFAGHEGGVSVPVRFESSASGTLTFSLDAAGRIARGSCWFKLGFAEENVAADETPMYTLE